MLNSYNARAEKWPISVLAFGRSGGFSSLSSGRSLCAECVSEADLSHTPLVGSAETHGKRGAVCRAYSDYHTQSTPHTPTGAPESTPPTRSPETPAQPRFGIPIPIHSDGGRGAKTSARAGRGCPARNFLVFGSFFIFWGFYLVRIMDYPVRKNKWLLF